jgi:hypothetical protein
MEHGRIDDDISYRHYSFSYGAANLRAGLPQMIALYRAKKHGALVASTAL